MLIQIQDAVHRALTEKRRRSDHAPIAQGGKQWLCPGEIDLTEHDASVLGEAEQDLSRALAVSAQSVDDCMSLLARARALLAGGRLSPHARALAQTNWNATAALVEYRRGTYGRAAALLGEAITATNQLIDDCGIASLEARRLELGANMIRLESRLGNREIAIRQGLRLLSYAEGNIDEWPFAQRVASQGTMSDVAHSCVSILMGYVGEALAIDDDTSRESFRAADAHLGQHGARHTGTCAPFGQIHDWLWIKQQFFSAAIESQLDAACAFLSRGRMLDARDPRAWLDRPGPTLWDLVALDVYRVAARQDSPIGEIHAWLHRALKTASRPTPMLAEGLNVS